MTFIFPQRASANIFLNVKKVTKGLQNTQKDSGIIVTKIYDNGIILPSASLLPPICLPFDSYTTLNML
jgi:hypothetical protein